MDQHDDGSPQDIRTTPIPCPVCGQLSDSIKIYNLHGLIFLVFMFVTQSTTHVCCRGCIRGKIAGFTAMNLITANLIWPLLILPQAVLYSLATLKRGHSRKIVAQIRQFRIDNYIE